jgi:predicted O-methyltransferase YrrM
MDFLPADIDEYAEKHTSEESKLLKRINRETHLEVLKPRMLSGHLQGRTLSALSKLLKPRIILEIGTYTGYSALCMAEGLADDGKIITIDINAELENRVRGYFAESPHQHKIDYRIGNALDLIPTMEENFDLVFIDADKVNYLNYYQLVVDKVVDGGLIIADNVLWSGKVIESRREKLDEDTEAIMRFNEFVHEDERVENLLLPLRDGMMILTKNS